MHAMRPFKSSHLSLLIRGKWMSEGQKYLKAAIGSYGLADSHGAVVDVPEIYFDSKFNLESPSSFEQTIHPKDRESEAQLSRLNMYLDFVEYSLLNQIWTRSMPSSVL